MAELTTFTAGYCTHIAAMALRGAGWHVCQFPARAYLISVGDRHWLWDTGYARHFLEHTQSGLFQIYRRMTPVYFADDEALLAQLRARGLAPSDISGLLLSHFHGDHIAGLRDFAPGHFICSGEGWQRTRQLRGFAALRRAFVPGLIPDGFETRLSFVEGFTHIPLPAELAPFTSGYALPESRGEVILVPLPGHAAGQIGAFVLTAEGWTLLASDAAWAPQGYRDLRGPSRLAHLIMDDTPAYYQTLRRLNQLQQGGKVSIRLCHEGHL
jgi:glyoxylase-like metal-dependent hydrolase (beta-lactamase superfamily II)